MQKVEQTYQKQSQKLNKLAPIMEGLENLSAQYSQRPEEWVPEAATFETAKSYREKKAMPLIQKLVKLLFALHLSDILLKKLRGNIRQSKSGNVFLIFVGAIFSQKLDLCKVRNWNLRFTDIPVQVVISGLFEG